MATRSAWQAVPTSEPGRFDRARRRTLMLRSGLAIALLATVALAVFVARSEDVRQTPLVPSDKTGILVLDLSASTSEAAFSQTIEKLAAADEKVGVVVFSDAAYELLPPGTPGRELLPLLRYFKPAADGSLPAHNPWEGFRAGTRISEGLRVGHDVLLREEIGNGSILLVSDFEILPDEIEHLAEQVAFLRRDGIDVRLVPLDPTPERRARMDAILGGSAVLRESSADSPVRPPESRTLAAAAPWTFLFAGALLVLLLSANEQLLSRLEVRR